MKELKMESLLAEYGAELLSLSFIQYSHCFRAWIHWQANCVSQVHNNWLYSCRQCTSFSINVINKLMLINNSKVNFKNKFIIHLSHMSSYWPHYAGLVAWFKLHRQSWYLCGAWCVGLCHARRLVGYHSKHH